jgi:predicted nucleotidyltransferase
MASTDPEETGEEPWSAMGSFDGTLFGRYAVVRHMERRDVRPELLDVLGEVVCVDPTIEFAVAFGSQITGEATQPSDLDIAIKFADGLSRHERFRKRCSLSGEIQRESAPFIDVADLETLPIDIAHDALDGEVICGDEQAFRTFKQEVVSAYRDQRDELRRRQSELIDRIAEDGLRG